MKNVLDDLKAAWNDASTAAKFAVATIVVIILLGLVVNLFGISAN